MMQNLTSIVDSITYRPGWNLFLEVTGGTMYFCVMTTGYDSYNVQLGPTYHTSHRFEVPDMLPDGGWQLWIFHQLCNVEKHEAMEFFQVNGGHPYAPVHSRAAGKYYDMPE